MINKNQLNNDFVDEFMESTKNQFKSMKKLAEKAIAQVRRDDKLFWLPDKESNSIAIIIKHLAGNMRSRWTNIFTEDGEKADRKRPTEFDRNFEPTRTELIELWEHGWNILFTTLDTIDETNFDKILLIRKEKHSVMEAIIRQLHHYSLHVGQILFIAKHLEWDTWKTLTIPRDKEMFDFKEFKK